VALAYAWCGQGGLASALECFRSKTVVLKAVFEELLCLGVESMKT